MASSSSSSLRLLHLPLLQGDNGHDNQEYCNKENEDTIRGWDQTLVGDSATDCTICSHAVAQGSVVHGTTTTTTTTATSDNVNDDEEDGGDTINNWISWHTTLDHTVGHVCSNRDGSIVVASTHAGTVSLLSGTDGSLLATRMVSKNLGTAAEISFVAKNNGGKDTLMIRVPDTSTAEATQIILVSNIDGPALNNSDRCLEATRSMVIEAVALPLPNVAILKATETSKGRLRFVVVTSDGGLCLFDYYQKADSKKKQLVPVAIAVSLDFIIQVSVGMTIQYHKPSNNAYLLFTTAPDPSAASTTTTGSKKACTLIWYSLSQLSVAYQYQVMTKTTILALEPVTSCSAESAMALAVSTKECIQIVQVVVEETMGLTILKEAHVVYKVPMSSSQVAALSASSDEEEFMYYAFRFANDDVCREFIASSPLVGSIRLLLEQERFEEAGTRILQHEQGQVDEYSHFHPTEVSLVRLQHVLAQPSMTGDTMRIAQECLQHLAQLDGTSIAIDNLLQASDAIYQWKSPQLSAYMLALTAMSQTLKMTIQNSANERLVAKRAQLEECRVAIHALSKLLVTLPNNQDDAKLDGSFVKIRSMSDLLRVLLSEGLFEAAASLHRSDQGRRLTPQVVVSTVISLSPDKVLDPRGYVSLLVTGIMGLDRVKHSILPTVSAWACRSADALVSSSEDDDNLESAIFLLQHVHNAMNQLQTRTYASYASFSPFVEIASRQLISPRNSSNHTNDASNSFRSNNSSSSTTLQERPSAKNSIDQPVPTILELGRLKGGAVKSSVVVRSTHMNDDDGDDCDDIEVKLRHAKVLQQARQLGLTEPSTVSLRQFVRQGGATYLARELVRMLSRNAVDHESRLEALHSKVQRFCSMSQVSFDEVLLSYGDEVCASKNMTQSTLVEATSLARCCIKDNMKCQITLTVLRSALLCGAVTPCLTELSKDAIDWAGGDLTMRSELTEATRLLIINSIAVTYCGRDAALELFRVDNPSHAVKLLAHVCRHVNHQEALSDALKLCDAFTHLSKEDACIQMLEMSILCGSVETCTTILSEVFDKEFAVGQSVWARALEFCSMALLDTCELIRTSKFRDSEKGTAGQLCSKALALLEVLQQRFSTRLLKMTTFAPLLDSYQRVVRLQRHHAIYVSPLELDSRAVQLRIVKSVVASIRKQFAEGNKDGSSLFEKARRATHLLVGKEDDAVSSVWFSAIEQEACQLVWSAEDRFCVQFLVQSGTLNNLSNHEAAQAVLSVVLNLCKRASQGAKDHNNIVSQMKLVLRASQLLHDYVLVSCPDQLLSVVSSLSNLTETIGRVLLMADNGVGDELENHRRQLRLWNCDVPGSDTSLSAPPLGDFKKPFLHSSWYVGDGLLLPLDETHRNCVDFCMDLVGLILCNQPPNLRGSDQLHSLLDERGAHSAALRVGCLTMAYTLSSSVFKPVENYQILLSFSTAYQNTLKSLAERSLGGSGNGITNPKVDSELALSYLHLLPIKLGFKVYKASLPTAITKRDFKRVRTLSNIGIVAGRGLQSSTRSGFVPRSWKKQGKFVEQLDGLSMRARWWMSLQSFHVDFDPRRFEESTRNVTPSAEASNDVRKDLQYATALLDPLIANCSDEFQDAVLPRSMTFSFCAAFGIDKQVAAQKHIEFLLSCPSIERRYSDDLRFDMSACEKAVRISLKYIASPMKRAALLRKVLVALEGNEDFDTDYERHGLLLSFYHEHLAMVVDDDASRKKIDVQPFVEELESVDRRRDALSVLMSFFEGEQRAFRPIFPKFFSPLPIVFKLVAGGNEPSNMGVLGPAEAPKSNTFDPLGPLQDFLVQHADASHATALAPLCVPLNLPQGYVHARTLVSRFQHSKASGGVLPSLDTDVLPVFNRLKSAKDQSILAEWCASMYPEDDDQRMQCLDIALEHAMKASAEIEQRARRNPTSYLESEEQGALDRVRTISNDKSVLSDKNQVTQILETSKIGDTDQFRAVKKMIDDLTARLNEDLWKRADAAPDQFVELLLVEASLIAASACLTMEDGFALDHLRYMAAVVHKACKEISEQYSHVHAGALCRKLARRWLVHGDSAVSSSDSEPAKIQTKVAETSSFDEDDDETVNFVMDLNAFGDGDRLWSDDVGSSQQDRREDDLVTREEEPSALDMLGSAREVSETDCSKVALRIAFVMSFAEGYHPKNPESPTNDSENAGDKQNKRSFTREGTKKKRRGLLSRIPVGESNHDSAVMEHGRELLRVVFAKSGGAKERSDSSLSFLSSVGNDGGAKAATFAMRYRALRTAAVLCPQEALERIIKDEGFLRNSNGEVSCTLRQCTFGAFVAKEIEEMGLVLPHSDLAQLSTMQFSSYARALRRNHDTNNLRTKGRLLLLMVEMSTVAGQSWDQTFVSSVLSEIRKLRLPRSLLYACERYMNFVDSNQSNATGDSDTEISACASELINCCVKEAQKSLSIDRIETLSRVADVVKKLHYTQPNLVRDYAQRLLTLMPSSQVPVQLELAELATQCVRYTQDSTSKTQLLEQMKSAAETNGVLRCQLIRNPSIDADQGTLKGRLGQLEMTNTTSI